MTNEIALVIAGALATHGVDALVGGGRHAFRSLVRLVRDRFRGNADDTAALDAALADPDDDGDVGRLAEAIHRHASEDSAFDRALEEAWSGASRELSVHGSSVVNHFSGRADRVVQARDIRGDINF